MKQTWLSRLGVFLLATYHWETVTFYKKREAEISNVQSKIARLKLQQLGVFVDKNVDHNAQFNMAYIEEQKEWLKLYALQNRGLSHYWRTNVM